MRGTLAFAALAVALPLAPSAALAGPPLIADDPNTVGPGFIQPIYAISAFHQGDLTLLRSPTLDLTVGVVDSLDATLIASPLIIYDHALGPELMLGGLFAPGFKWQFFRSDRGRLAFSPALEIDTIAPEKIFGLLPVQGEFSLGNRGSVVGFDVGYIPIRLAKDGWFVAVYGSYAATGRLNILAEVWSVSPGPPDVIDIGGSIGIDYGIVGNKYRLLASWSTGIVSIGAPRVEARAYLGLQYTFGAR